MKRSFKLSIIAFLAGLFLTACASQKTTVEKQPNFELIIFEQVEGLNIDKYPSPTQAQAALKAADTKDPLFVIGLGQIEEYNWDLQTITLTRDATEQLAEALVRKKGTGSDGLTKFKEMIENLGWSNSLELALYIKPFAVKVNDQFKYGGIFLDALSQLPIDFPVIRVAVTDGKAVLALLPMHIVFYTIDPIDGDGNWRDSGIAAEAKDDVAQLDNFRSWSTGFATADTSVNFRALIRDKTIKRIFETAGKLKQ